MIQASLPAEPLILTFVVGTIAAICLVGAAIGPLPPRRRATLALVGIVVDWIPVLAGWMTLNGAAPRSLLFVHLGFGVVGYLLLVYCLLAWIQGRERARKVRLAFVGIWGLAYLAGVGMVVTAWIG